jgi:hypothetical protein
VELNYWQETMLVHQPVDTTGNLVHVVNFY